MRSYLQSWVLLLALCSAASAAPSQVAEPAPPKVGEPAPPLRLAEVVQSPQRQPVEDVTPAQLSEELRGRIVVIEFWATWCGPCLAAMRSMDVVERAAAAAEDAGDFVFLYVTDEDPQEVRQWLADDERRRPAGWVVCDQVPPNPAYKLVPGGATFTAWGVTGRPRTWVLRPEGEGHVIAGWVHPFLLTLDDLRRVRDGLPPLEMNADGGGGVLVPRLTPQQAEQHAALEAVGRARAPTGHDPLLYYENPAGETPEADVFLTIRQAAPGLAGGGYGAWVDSSIGVTAEEAVARLHGRFGDRVEWAPGAKEALPAGKFDVIARIPRERHTQYRPMMEAAMAAAFGVKGRYVEREVDVYELHAGPETAARLQPSAYRPGDGGGATDWRLSDGVRRLEFINGDISMLASMLQLGEVDRPIFDATGLPDRKEQAIDLAIEFREGDLEDMERVLERELDLRLVPATRMMTFLLIEPIEPDIEE